VRIGRSIAVGVVLFVATLAGVLLLTGRSGVLTAARVPIIIAAAGFYSVGFLIFSTVWTLLLRRLPAASGSAGKAPVAPARAFSVALVALAGLLTPMNLGTDVLRSMLGRRYLGLDIATTAAASVVARECKLHVTLVLLPVPAAFSALVLADGQSRLLSALAGVLVLAVVLRGFRSDAAKGLARSLRVGRLVEATRDLQRQLGWRPRVATYMAFGAGIACEWEALRLCFQALSIPAETRVSLGAFGALYLLARTPVVPFGIGLVEAGGLAWLRLARVPFEESGALILIWSALRILVPHALALAAFSTFLVEPRR
jgi:hypothetical protein